MKKLAASFAIVMLAAVGCGHDDGDAKTSTITQPPVTVTDTPTSTVKVSPTETKVVQPTDTVTAPTQTVTETP